jgi:hypothetical protein
MLGNCLMSSSCFNIPISLLRRKRPIHAQGMPKNDWRRLIFRTTYFWVCLHKQRPVQAKKSCLKTLSSCHCFPRQLICCGNPASPQACMSAPKRFKPMSVFIKRSSWFDVILLGFRKMSRLALMCYQPLMQTKGVSFATFLARSAWCVASTTSLTSL